MMSQSSVFPNIDPRIKAVGVSKLRDMNAGFLRKLNEDLYIVQEGDEPLAVIISYGQYLVCQTMNGLYLNGRKVSDNRQGWHEAWTYTESVREECRQLDREIEQQHHFESELHRGTFPGNMDALQSTIKRLRTLREAAGRGMREEK
jgi:hypothetical protein